MFIPPGIFNDFQGDTLKFRQYLSIYCIVRQEHKGRKGEIFFNLIILCPEKANLESFD